MLIKSVAGKFEDARTRTTARQVPGVLAKLFSRRVLAYPLCLPFPALTGGTGINDGGER